MKKIPLHWKIIIGLIVGILWAVAGGYFGWSQFTGQWIAPFGRIFINLLKLIAVPLVFFSIIGGIIQLGKPANLGRLGGKTMAIYLLTTLFAISVGLLIVNVFKPGKSFDDQIRLENRLTYELWLQSEGLTPQDGNWFIKNTAYNTILDEVISRKGYEELDDVRARLTVAEKAKEQGPLTFLEDVVPDNIFLALQDNKSMIQIIFFAIFFGIAVLYLPSGKTEILKDLMEVFTGVFIKMVDLIMLAAPFFVFAQMAGMVSEMAGDNPARVLELFKGLTWYSLCVLGGLLFIAFIAYPLLITILVKKISFDQFLKGISPAQMLAFSTSSSAATLPVTLECVEQNLKVDKRISSFVIPIGATINMDGTSLYQAVAVVFLAQMHMIDLTFAQQMTIVLTTTLASIGAAAIPGAGVVMLMVVLSSVGLNPAWIAIILPVDRILDMARTVVNVSGDATVALLVDSTTDLNTMDYATKQND
jgi:Na+/H+-dicarboxylate symporter